MTKLAKVGDIILFIGNYELATDGCTFDIMKSCLTIGEFYTVKDVVDYNGNMYYKLKRMGG